MKCIKGNNTQQICQQNLSSWWHHIIYQELPESWDRQCPGSIPKTEKLEETIISTMLRHKALNECNHYLNSLNWSEVLLSIAGWNVLGFCCSQRKHIVRVKEMESPWLEIMCRNFGALCVCVCTRRDLRSGRDTGVRAKRAAAHYPHWEFPPLVPSL